MYTLCLSGGGFRATLFHLGVVRRLIYLDIFEEIKRINSVSGGSILAGVIMRELSLNGDFNSVEDFDERVTIPIIDFIQNSPKKNFYIIWPFERSPNRFIKVLDKGLFKGMSFNEIKHRIDWCCYATSLNSTRAWKFSKKGIGDNYYGHTDATDEDKISMGVAASACFPPLFKAMVISTVGKKFESRYNKIPIPSKIFLTDGGVYDNLGVESLLNNDRRTDYQGIISDASSIIEHWESPNPNRFMKLKRTMDISMGQSNKLRRRLLFEKVLNKDRGVLIEVVKPIETYVSKKKFSELSQNIGTEIPCYPVIDSEIQRNIGELRTDLNAFHDIEIQLLIWNGMIKIDAALKRWETDLVPEKYWNDVPILKLTEDEKYKVNSILKAGDDMKIFESHKKLHQGRPLRDCISERL